MSEQLDLYLREVSPEFHDFLNEIDSYLKERGCAIKTEQAKSGLVVSYVLPKTKKVLCNYVIRKSGPVVRIYADSYAAYSDFISALPDKMKQSIAKSSDCKRLYDPAKCNSRCPMGYQVSFDGEEHKKCRYGAFMFEINFENSASIQSFIKNELEARLGS